MDYTEEQKHSFKESFAARRKAQIIVAAVLLILVFAFIFGEDQQTGTFLGISMSIVGPIFLVVVLGAIGFSFKNWRCPACNRYLGRVINPRHCHSCGVELR